MGTANILQLMVHGGADSYSGFVVEVATLQVTGVMTHLKLRSNFKRVSMTVTGENNEGQCARPPR